MPQHFIRKKIKERSRLVGLAIDARKQRYPDEISYEYKPLRDDSTTLRWKTGMLETLKDYNMLDFSI